MPSPSPLDLTTLANARSWIFGQNPSATSDNQTLQILITALSLDFLRRTGRAAQNQSVPSQSPFNQVCTYAENYSGYGTPLIQLRNFPIQSVSAVTLYGSSVPQSTGPTVYGWFIEASGEFLGIRNGPNTPLRGTDGWNGWGSGTRAQSGAGWPKGIDCIAVNYTAGFPANVISGEPHTIPATPSAWAANTLYTNGSLIFDGTNVQQAEIVAGTSPTASSGSSTPSWNGTVGLTTADGSYLVWTNLGPPYALTVNNLPWLADGGVSYFSDGTQLAPVTTAPAEGQYYLQGNGGYLFNSADAGKQLLIGYSSAGTPMDIQEMMLRWVNLIYKRRGWEGVRSLMSKDAGSTIYTSFEIDPSMQHVIDAYKRRV